MPKLAGFGGDGIGDRTRHRLRVIERPLTGGILWIKRLERELGERGHVRSGARRLLESPHPAGEVLHFVG